MSSPSDKLLGLGWDVRGWRSRQQAVAAAEIRQGELRWSGLAPAFGFETGQPVAVDALVLPALGHEWQAQIDAADRVVVAIDSPLAFPQALKRLLAGDWQQAPTASEIQNPLAYRDCDRRVAEAYGKKPLSAAFDRLGNTASLAMTWCQSAREAGFSVVPQDADSASKAVIEVYPGIHKCEARRASAAVPAIARWIPDAAMPGTDLYDACICAILALVFAGAGDILELPRLTKPEASMPRDEGWIFGLPPDSVAMGYE